MTTKVLIIFMVSSLALMGVISESSPQTTAAPKKIWIVDASPHRTYHTTYCAICQKNIDRAHGLNEFMMHLLNDHKESNVKMFSSQEFKNMATWSLKYSFESAIESTR